MAFTPTSQMSCYSNDEEMKVNTECSTLIGKTNDDCQSARDAFDKKKQQCSIKTVKHSFLFGALLIPFAILLIMYSRSRDKLVQNNDVAANLTAMSSELEMIGLGRSGINSGIGTGIGTGINSGIGTGLGLGLLNKHGLR